MNLKKIHLFLSIIISLPIFQSCEEEFLLPSPEKIENTQLYSEVMSELLSIWRRIDEGMRNPTIAIGGQVIIDQATVAINGNTLVIDYGNIQKLCADGKTRKGRIEASINGIYGMVGGNLTINFKDFKVNGNLVKGQLHLMTTSITPTFNFSSSDFEFRDFLISFNSDINWISGFETNIFLDDSLTFSLSGTAARQSTSFGFNFKTHDQHHLTCALGCQYRILSGIVNLHTHSDSSRVDLDFIESDGCNDLVRVFFINEKYNTFIKFTGF